MVLKPVMLPGLVKMAFCHPAYLNESLLYIKIIHVFHQYAGQDKILYQY